VRAAAVIAKKELRSALGSPAGFVYLTAFLVLSSWLFFRGFFAVGQASMRSFFSLMPWLFLFFVPAAAMRAWAEERRSGTDEILLTLPVADVELVVGKFAAGMGFLALAVALTLPVPLTVAAFGDPDLGPIVGGYAGLLLLGAAYMAVSLFASSLSANQIVAFVVGVSVSFGLFVIGEDFVLVAAPRALAPTLRYVGLGQHFSSIARGVIDSRDIVYYCSVVVFFLTLNLKVVEARKWR